MKINDWRRRQPRSGDQIVAHGATVGFIGQPSQPRMGRKKCSDDAVFLALLPELLPRCALTHSSRCGLLAHAAPQLGLPTWQLGRSWRLVGEKKKPRWRGPAGLRKTRPNLFASFFRENLWQIHHAMSDTKDFNICSDLIKNQPVLESIHTP